MRINRKRHQREEVRKILHTMRLELAAQRLCRELSTDYNKAPTLRLNEFLQRVQQTPDYPTLGARL
jgi:hypothetical protein